MDPPILTERWNVASKEKKSYVKIKNIKYIYINTFAKKTRFTPFCLYELFPVNFLAKFYIFKSHGCIYELRARLPCCSKTSLVLSTFSEFFMSQIFQTLFRTVFPNVSILTCNFDMDRFYFCKT